jgi:DNA-binding MarR family transcriptional regulator
MVRKASAAGVNVNKDLPGLEAAFVIGPLIGRVRAIALTALDVEMQPFGISGMQFLIMKHLGDGVVETAADLCRLMHYDAGSMTRLLDKLEEKGWIRRERAKDDRRIVRLRVTGAGRGVLPRLLDSAARIIQRMLSGFNAAEIGDLRSYLTRMVANGEAGRGASDITEGKV